MAYVIAEPCTGTKDTACVDVCPVTASTRARTKPALKVFRSSILIRSNASIAARVCRFARSRRFSLLRICPRSGRVITPVNSDFFAAKVNYLKVVSNFAARFCAPFSHRYIATSKFCANGHSWSIHWPSQRNPVSAAISNTSSGLYLCELSVQMLSPFVQHQAQARRRNFHRLPPQRYAGASRCAVPRCSIALRAGKRPDRN